MFCTQCGNKLDEGSKFCTGCGMSQVHTSSQTQSYEQREKSVQVTEEKWWHRVGVVAYVIAHLPLLIVVPIVWEDNAQRYSYILEDYIGSDSEAFWACIMTIFFWILTLRLIKMTLKYIVSAKKPKFKDLLYF